jgi:hypothetical protein
MRLEETQGMAKDKGQDRPEHVLGQWGDDDAGVRAAHNGGASVVEVLAGAHSGVRVEGRTDGATQHGVGLVVRQLAAQHAATHKVLAPGVSIRVEKVAGR